MPFFIRAHFPDNSLILGNGEGQACIRHRRPHLTHDWRLLGTPGARACPRVHHWTLIDQFDRVYLTKPNPNFLEIH